jgi:hypothetical protein
MDLGSLFLILALLLLVALFIGRPLFEQEAYQREARSRNLAASELGVSQMDHEQSTLLAERDRILGALRELDFDYALGKIPEEDYPAQRSLLVQNGANVLRSLDALQPDPSVDDVEERLEAAIAARRADVGLSASSAQPLPSNGGASATTGRGVSVALAAPDDDLEALLAKRRRVRQDKAAGFCPRCGAPLQKSDRFCPRCGSKSA